MVEFGVHPSNPDIPQGLIGGSWRVGLGVGFAGGVRDCVWGCVGDFRPNLNPELDLGTKI